MRFGPVFKERRNELPTIQNQRSDLHQLSENEWLLVQIYRRSCLDHQENILEMAQETLLICKEFSVQSVVGNVIPIRTT